MHDYDASCKFFLQNLILVFLYLVFNLSSARTTEHLVLIGSKDNETSCGENKTFAVSIQQLTPIQAKSVLYWDNTSAFAFLSHVSQYYHQQQHQKCGIERWQRNIARLIHLIIAFYENIQNSNAFISEMPISASVIQILYWCLFRGQPQNEQQDSIPE